MESYAEHVIMCREEKREERQWQSKALPMHSDVEAKGASVLSEL